MAAKKSKGRKGSSVRALAPKSARRPKAAPGSRKGAGSVRRQVFVAYSYRLYPKADYRKVFRALERQYDVTFIFADEKITNMHIMKKIESFIRTSDFCVFDISGWNPNVTIELGFAMALGDEWYIAIDPSKTEVKEVPSDLRGLDRIEYASYSELESKLRIVMEERYAKRRTSGIDDFLDEKRAEARKALRQHPGFTMIELAQVLDIEVRVAQLALKPLVESGELETEGRRKGTRYYLRKKGSRSKRRSSR